MRLQTMHKVRGRGGKRSVSSRRRLKSVGTNKTKRVRAILSKRGGRSAKSWRRKLARKRGGMDEARLSAMQTVEQKMNELKLQTHLGENQCALMRRMSKHHLRKLSDVSDIENTTQEICTWDLDEWKRAFDELIEYSRIQTTAIFPSGKEYSLGELSLKTTVRQIKNSLEDMDGTSVKFQKLYNTNDGRSEDDDMTLRDQETLEQVWMYEKGWETEGAGAVLNLLVTVHEPVDDVVEWVKDIKEDNPITIQAKTDDGTLDRSEPFSSIATIPNRPHLIVTICTNKIRVYNTGTGNPLECSVNRQPVSFQNALEMVRTCRVGVELNHPSHVVVTKDSTHIIVSETLGNRLQVFSLNIDKAETTAQLGFVREIGNLNAPRGLALRTVHDIETVLVAESDGRLNVGHWVSEWAIHNGAPIGKPIGGYGREDGQFYQPNDVAVLPNSSHIAVADTYNRRICIFNSEGKFITKFGGDFDLEHDGGYAYPRAIAADSHDNIFILDMTNRLQICSAKGEHLYTRKDLGINAWDYDKSLEWWEGEGIRRLAIANGIGHRVRHDEGGTIHQELIENGYNHTQYDQLPSHALIFESNGPMYYN